MLDCTLNTINIMNLAPEKKMQEQKRHGELLDTENRAPQNATALQSISSLETMLVYCDVTNVQSRSQINALWKVQYSRWSTQSKHVGCL